MEDNKDDLPSSRLLLQRIGILEEGAGNLLLDEDPLEDPMQCLIHALTERHEDLKLRHPFKSGDIVTWKPGLDNRRYPRMGFPAVVLEVLEKPLFDVENDSSSPYFREPLDMIIGTYVEKEGKPTVFLTWHVDSRRFRPWPQGDQA